MMQLVFWVMDGQLILLHTFSNMQCGSIACNIRYTEVLSLMTLSPLVSSLMPLFYWNMVIDSKYTKIFKSNGMTRQKYDELVGFAIMLRDHKNLVSEYVNSNLEHYLEYSKLDFLKEMRARYKDVVSSSFDVQLYIQVFNCYQNKFEAIRKHLDFEVVRFVG